jgi:hypothetical protein
VYCFDYFVGIVGWCCFATEDYFNGKSLKCPTFWPLSLIYPTFAKESQTYPSFATGNFGVEQQLSAQRPAHHNFYI